MHGIERACILLLDRCGVTEADGPMVGDLLEEFNAGKSHWWLLREVFSAIGGAVVRDIATSKLTALHAVLVGLLVAVPLNALIGRASYVIGGIGQAQFLALTCLSFAIAGAAIGCKFPRRPFAMTTAFTFYAVFAKSCLVVMNLSEFRSSSDPAHFAVAAAAVILPPVWALAGALSVRRWAPGRW